MTNSFFFSLGAWNWFIIAAVLAVAEILVPGYLLMWYAMAAMLVGGLAQAIDLSWQLQLGLYALIGIGLLIASMRFAGARAGKSDHPTLNKRVLMHKGKVYKLVEPTSHGRGRIKVGDGVWSVQLEDGADLPDGAGVLITGMDGTTFTGKQAKPAA